jgi:hypothetical protein
VVADAVPRAARAWQCARCCPTPHRTTPPLPPPPTAGDELWLGKGLSRLQPFLVALAAALAAHQANTAANAEAAEAGEEEDEEDGSEELFTHASLDKLRAVLAGVPRSPIAAQVAQIVGGMRKKQRAALRDAGLA